MKYVYLHRFHLYELGAGSKVNHLLIKNSYPDPRSIRENVFSEINHYAKEQLEILKKHFAEYFNDNVEVGKEIGRMEVYPIGEELYKDTILNALRIKYIAYKETPWCILGTAKSKEDFLREYDEGIEEYGEGYSRNVNEFSAFFMPSSCFKNIINMGVSFKNYSRWDYEDDKWVQ